MRFPLIALSLGVAVHALPKDYESSTDFVKGESKNLYVPGGSPSMPLFIDAIPTEIEVGLFPENQYLDTRQREIFEVLVGEIIEAQIGIQKVAPSIAKKFEKAIKLWEILYELIPNYKILRQINYINALEALLEALSYLEKCKEEEKKGLKSVALTLLADNIFLTGFFNSVFEEEIVPTYLIGQPGEVVGILIKFLKIDVRYPIDLW